MNRTIITVIGKDRVGIIVHILRSIRSTFLILISPLSRAIFI